MPELNILIERVLLAVLLGGIIGAEREFRNKAAGFRTMILISTGACLFTIFSMAIGTGNPDRIASNIVTGIGFIGAGVIFKTDDRVKGLTTAAVIWLTAALGMGIGAGYYLIAMIGCGISMMVLVLFIVLEGWIDRLNQIRTYTIVCEYTPGISAHFEKLFHHNHLKYKRVRESKKGTEITGTWLIQGSKKNHDYLSAEIMSDKSILAFDF